MSQKVTELLPEHTYYFYVYATNAVGTDSAYGIIETSPEPPDTGLGNGSGAGKPVELEESPWVREGGEREAAEAPLREAEREAEAARRTQEAAAQAAAQASHERELREQGERAGREAAERAARERSAVDRPAPRCVVPKLKGDTLKSARRALERSDCRLGTVHEERRGRSRLAVVAQRAKPGTRLPSDSRVGVTLAPG